MLRAVSRLTLLIVVALAPLARADDAFRLKEGASVVFFGDSITQSGQYITYFEAYLLTRFPEKSFRIINHGISSETISGTSEPDHEPRRPWAHERFTRDVAAWKPDVVVACFGMNDGNYFPFERERFEKYQAGVQRLIERTRQEAGADLILMTPPPFDPYRRKASDESAVSYGYKFPAIDYDETLRRYSEWLITQRSDALPVVDLHTALNEHQWKRRESRVSFFLAGDAVHPNATGHWLMAQHLLLALGARAVADEVEVDAVTGTAPRGDVRDVANGDGVLSFAWTSRLPMPMDPSWDAESIELEQVRTRLNRYRMKVTGLAGDKYRLLAEGEPFAEVTGGQLALGLDLLDFPAFPTVKRSGRVLSLLQERNQLSYLAWRQEIGRPLGPLPAGVAERIAHLTAELEQIRQPKVIQVRLEPIDTGN